MVDEMALNELIKRVESGDAAAMRSMGAAYLRDDMSDKENQKKAFYYLKQAADCGDCESQRIVAHFYTGILGKEEDIEMAIKYYRMAACQNDVLAQYNLGRLLYENPAYDKENEKEHWLCCAHLNGNGDATDFLNEKIGDDVAYHNAFQKQMDEISKNDNVLPITHLPAIMRTEGCYIATAVYGDYNAKEVIILRNYRDAVLKKYLFGRVFIKIYYLLSPFIANKLRSADTLNRWVKRGLDHMVRRIQKNMSGK